VMLIGTPALWWPALLVLGFALWRTLTRFDWRHGAVLLAYAAGILPWFANMERQMYYFYMAPLAPFLVLATVLAMEPEILVLEQCPLRSRNPNIMTLGRRSALLHAPHGSDVLGRSILSGLAMVFLVVINIAVVTLLRMGRYEEASEVLENAIRIDRQYDRLYSRLAEARLALGDTASAIVALNRFLDISLDRRARDQARRLLEELERPAPVIVPLPPVDTMPRILIPPQHCVAG
jgi:tetratricopeptide (TPR) repeat protein